VVTVPLVPGKQTLSQEVRAGSSYLSSEDPRVHFGLGPYTRVANVTVHYPWGGESVLRNVRADRIVDVKVPPRRVAHVPTPASYRLPACTAATHGRSLATVWQQTAAAALRSGDASEPVQARDLYDLSTAMWKALSAAPKNTAARNATLSYAAYRVLLWHASFDSNLSRTFAQLTGRMRALCYSPDFASTYGGSPAALGNRIAAAVVAAGRHDGSNESLHFADPTFTSRNLPLVIHSNVSTEEDSTFWVPLALGTVQPHSLSPVPARVQSFVGAEWGHVRSFALPHSRRGLPIDPGAPPLGDPSGRAYKQQALAVLRATSAKGAPERLWSPLDWSGLAAHEATGNLARDVRLYLGVDAALNDAAVAAWGAKRAYPAPRPISIIRYAAFQGQSSNRKSKHEAYTPDGLPLVPGLVEYRGGKLEVLSGGRWVEGAAWTPPVATPPSPGAVAEGSAFAYAAGRVLAELTGRSFASRIHAASMAPLRDGIDVPSDVTAGRKVGEHVAALVLRRLRAYR
jgi:hypothetical protein